MDAAVYYKPTTMIHLYKQVSKYDPDKGGAYSEWEKLTSSIGDMEISAFYCQWNKTHGEQQTTLYSSGIEQSATIRMGYVPVLYNAIETNSVIIAKNGKEILQDNGIPDVDNPNCWEVLAGADNIREENTVMEFQVKRYEGK